MQASEEVIQKEKEYILSSFDVSQLNDKQVDLVARLVASTLLFLKTNKYEGNND